VFTTWQELGGLADAAGQEAERSDGNWREAATQPDAPAAQRLLLELVWYLEKKGYAVAKPLEKRQLAIYRQARELEATLGALVAGATERLTDERVGRFWLEKPRREAVDDAPGQRFVTPTGSWVHRYKGKLYLEFDDEPDPEGPRTRELRVSATVYLPTGQADRLRLRSAFMSDLASRGLHFAVDEYGGYCWAALPASELTALSSIDEQIERLAVWAKDAFATLLALKPGPNRA
jgi:hypothetical protein